MKPGEPLSGCQTRGVPGRSHVSSGCTGGGYPGSGGTGTRLIPGTAPWYGSGPSPIPLFYVFYRVFSVFRYFQHFPVISVNFSIFPEFQHFPGILGP